MHNKLLHRFFSNNKVLLLSAHTSYIIVKKQAFECLRKKQFLLLLRHDYMRNKLARLRGYLIHRDAADMSNLFNFNFVFI